MNALEHVPSALRCGFGQDLAVRRIIAANSGCGIVARSRVSESFYRIEGNIVDDRPNTVTSRYGACIKPTHRHKAVEAVRVGDDQQRSRLRAPLE
jgi:hypothetical protein